MKILDAIINWLEKYGRPLWYIVMLILAVVYVAMNYCDFILSEMFEDLTGRHIIFIACLVLLVSPLFDTFEGFGFKLGRTKREKMDSELNELSKKPVVEDNIQVENLENKLNGIKRLENK